MMMPMPSESPSAARIMFATAAALIVAASVLVAAVLPAEYGVDPLGTGKALGLNELYGAASGESKRAPAPPAPVAGSFARYKIDSTVFTLKPMEGFEYKYRIEKGGGLVYVWTASGNVKSDFHGERDGAAPGVAVSYDTQEGDRASGSFTAPSSGIHGWYWENVGNTDMTVTLNSAGFYSYATEFRSHFDPIKHKTIIDETRHEFQ